MFHFACDTLVEQQIQYFNVIDEYKNIGESIATNSWIENKEKKSNTQRATDFIK